MTKDDIAQGLRICGKKMGCGHCPGKGLQDPLGERLCTELLMLRAAALIEQQDARIAGLEAKVPRWIPVEERLPKKGEDGRRDSDWVHCIVSVIWTYGSNFADGDAGTHMFSAPALFDADQKIWRVGSTDESSFSVNALIPLENSDGDFFVTRWMLYPKLPQEGT